MKYLDAFHLGKKLQLLRPRGPLLGLDIGSNNIGVAISDMNLKFAYPLCVLEKTPYNTEDIASQLNNMKREFNLSALVMGYPYLRGKINPEAVHVHDLIDGLVATKMLEDVTYTTWDETYTNVLFERMVGEIPLGPLRKPYGDMFAGVGILQACMDAMRRHDKIMPLIMNMEDRTYVDCESSAMRRHLMALVCYRVRVKTN